MPKISVEKRIQDENERIAGENRRAFAEAGVLVLNLVSSPGSGKTTLLEATLDRLPHDVRSLVIEGDVSTDRDLVRVKAHGADGIQINTGGGCHLSAKMVADAARQLDLAAADIVFIENVGNLICPATYDLGEDGKVVLLATTEGDDKPMKYPAVFHESRLAILNKIDLLPHLAYDVGKVEREVAVLNPRCEILKLSALRGDGMDAWIAWILARAGEKRGT
jgi:hydrogenase nickel incorporation protein HypB